MRPLSFLLVGLSLFISCSTKETEREKIEEEKQRLRILNLAQEEFIQEEKDKALSIEIETNILRFENAYPDLALAKTEQEKLETLAQLEGIFIRMLRTDNLFLWIDDIPEGNYEKLKSFEIEFNPKEEPEYIAKSKLYIEAKNLGGNSIIGFSSILDGEKGKLLGTIVRFEFLE